MREFKIKGISLRINNTFYVDIEPNQRMYYAYDYILGEFMNEDEDYCDELGEYYLNIAYNLDKDNDEFNLSTYFSEYGWRDIPYKCSEVEKKAVLDFINEWKDKVPENPEGEAYIDDMDYTQDLSDDIPWKMDVLR